MHRQTSALHQQTGSATGASPRLLRTSRTGEEGRRPPACPAQSCADARHGTRGQEKPQDIRRLAAEVPTELLSLRAIVMGIHTEGSVTRVEPVSAVSIVALSKLIATHLTPKRRLLDTLP